MVLIGDLTFAYSMSKDLQMKILPEMLFGNNYVKLIHKDGFTLEFNAKEALKEVNPAAASELKVAYSKEWIARLY